LIIDKTLLFGGWSIGGLFWLVNKYFAAVLHRKRSLMFIKAGADDTVGQGRWIGGRSFEKARHNLHKSAHFLGEFPSKRAFISTMQTYLSGTPFFQNAL
jgi:hypothetical protein